MAATASASTSSKPTKRRSDTKNSAAAPSGAPGKASTNSSADASHSLQSTMPRQILRYCVVTVVIAALAFAATFAVPAVQFSSLSGESLTRAAQLTTSKVAPHVQRAGGDPSVEVLAVYPHDIEAFTQGFLVVQERTEKFFIESTGLYGESTLRKVDITTGAVITQYELPSSLFGEGVTLGPSGELVMITWKEKKGLTFALEAAAGGKSQLILKGEFSYETTNGEGWGIDYDGTHLVVSDGSSKIMFWDAKTKMQLREITVSFNGEEIPQINELEVANGFIYANVWYENVIVKIDPANGKIVTVFDCSDIVAQSGAAPGNANAVLNGIAYDGDEDVFYITGKQWGHVFKVRLLE